MKIPAPNLFKITPLLFVVAIGGIFAFYYLKYIPGRTSQIDQQNFRVLSRINENISERYASWRKRLVIADAQEFRCSNISDSLFKFEYKTHDRYAVGIEGVDLCDVQKTWQSFDKNYFTRNIDMLGQNNETNQQPPFPAFESGKTKPKTLKDFYGSIKMHSNILKKKGISFQQDGQIYVVKPKGLLGHLFRRDVFSDFIILQNEDGLKEATAGRINKDDEGIPTLSRDSKKAAQSKNFTKIIEPGNLEGLFDNQFDTLSNFSNEIGLNVVDMPIDMSRYRVYFQNIEIEGQNYIICGLYSSSKFTNSVNQIPVYILIIVIFGALILALALPIIKLAMINKFERNNKTDVFTISVTSLLGMGVISLFIFFLMHFINMKQRSKEESLLNLSNDIHEKLSQEISEILAQIELLDLSIESISQVENVKLTTVIQDLFSSEFLFTTNENFNAELSQEQVKFSDINRNRLVTMERIKLLDDQTTIISDKLDAFKKNYSDSSLQNADSTFKNLIQDYYSLVKDQFSFPQKYYRLQFDYYFGKKNVKLKDIFAVKKKYNPLSRQIDSLRARVGLTIKNDRYPYYLSYSLVENESQRLKWQTANKPPQKILDLENRNYISAIKKGRGWIPLPDSQTSYYFEPVFSKSTGEITTEFSSKNKGLKVGKFDTDISVISTKLYSLSNSIAPRGYQFAVLDKRGEVMYHLVDGYVKQENFLKECSDPSNMAAAIQSRTQHSGETKYHSRGIQYIVSPIQNTEYFLVVFREKRYENLVLLNSLTTSFTLFVILVGVLLLLSYLQHLFLLPKYKFIKRVYFLDWLRPKVLSLSEYEHRKKEYDERPPSGSEKYDSLDPFVDNCIKLFVFQLVAVLLLFTLTFFVASPDQSLYAVFAMFIMPIVFFPYSYNLLNLQDFHKMSLIRRLRNLLPVLGVLLILNIILGVYFYDGSMSFKLIVIQVVIATFPLIFLVSKKFSFHYVNFCKRWYMRIFHNDAKLAHFRLLKIRFVPYYLCLSLWVVFIALLPNLVFVKHYYDAENVIYRIYQGHEMAKSIKLKTRELDRRWTDIKYFMDENRRKSFIKDKTIYDMGLFNVTFGCNDTLDAVLTQANVLSSLDLIRPNLTGYNKASSSLLKKPSHFSLGDTSIKYQSDYAVKSDLFIHPIRIESSAIYDFQFKPRVGFIGIIAFLLFIVAIYFFITFISRKLFAVNSVIGYELGKYLGSQMDPAKHYLIWHPNENLPSNTFKCLGDEKSPKKHEEYLDSHISDPISLMNFISDIEKKVKSGHQILLVSRYCKDALDEYFSEKTTNGSDDNQHWHLAKAAWDGFKLIFIDWTVTIQNSITDTDKVKKLVAALIDDNCLDKEEAVYTKLKRDLIEEFSQEKELVDIGEKIKTFKDQYGANLHLSFEEIVIKLEESASAFYHRLWQGCSKVEKFILYDLARDGYVNTQNKEAILKLCQKGLITSNGSLRVMNESFRNFVFKNMEPKLIKEIEINVVEKGRWNKFRTPLIIALVAVAAFIFITQEEIFSKSIAFITTLLTIIPALLRFLPSSKPLPPNP